MSRLDLTDPAELREARAEIERLRRERDELRTEIAQHAMVIAAWKREELDWHEDNRALLAENYKLSADALRYRWLRDRSTPPDAVYIATDRITQSMVGDSIDAAIDAAMSIDAAMAQEPPR